MNNYKQLVKYEKKKANETKKPKKASWANETILMRVLIYAYVFIVCWDVI